MRHFANERAFILIPVSVILGRSWAFGAFFLWTLKSGQYDEPAGASARVFCWMMMPAREPALASAFSTAAVIPSAVAATGRNSLGFTGDQPTDS